MRSLIRDLLRKRREISLSNILRGSNDILRGDVEKNAHSGSSSKFLGKFGALHLLLLYIFVCRACENVLCFFSGKEKCMPNSKSSITL